MLGFLEPIASVEQRGVGEKATARRRPSGARPAVRRNERGGKKGNNQSANAVNSLKALGSLTKFVRILGNPVIVAIGEW